MLQIGQKSPGRLVGVERGVGLLRHDGRGCRMRPTGLKPPHGTPAEHKAGEQGPPRSRLPPRGRGRVGCAACQKAPQYHKPCIPHLFIPAPAAVTGTVCYTGRSQYRGHLPHSPPTIGGKAGHPPECGTRRTRGTSRISENIHVFMCASRAR